MAELYRYFLNLARLGFELGDAIARAATRFVNYSSTMVYNAAIAAFASKGMANAMQNNPFKSLGSFLDDATDIVPKLYHPYTSSELVQFYPQLISPPYNSYVVIGGVSESASAYKSYNVPISIRHSWEEIKNYVDQRADNGGSPPILKQYQYYVTFIDGQPQIIFR